MCRFQYLAYSCGCTPPQPIFTGCPPDRCHGSYIDRTPKRMNHACAACAHRSQNQARTQTQIRKPSVFDDGSNAARRDSVRRWEARSASRRQHAVEYNNGRRRPSGLTLALSNAFGNSRSREPSASADRRTQTSYRTLTVSPPPLRRHTSRRRGSSLRDEMMRYSSEENEYTIRYNRGSGEWSSVVSPRQRRHRRRGDQLS